MKEHLNTFFNLMMATCRRQGLSPNPNSESFLHKMWEVLYAKGHLKLFLAEYERIVISSGLLLAFGREAQLWKVGWSGEKKKVRPNYVLWWKMIKWAKENNYNCFDIRGLDRVAAEAILSNKKIPENTRGSTLFKLKFLGTPVLLPKSYEYIKNPAARVGVNLLSKNPRVFNFIKKGMRI
jgi:lipid II:glycine glycyltransferase (peptidoglycan interpeptide bridge formation enzyme)